MISNGKFEVRLYRAPQTARDDEYRRAIAAGRLGRLLRAHTLEVHCPLRNNLASDNLPSWFFDKIMSGGVVQYPYRRGVFGTDGLATIHLSNYDHVPTYTEYQGEIYTGINTYPGVVGSSAKRFVEDDVVDQRIVTWADAAENLGVGVPRESLLFRATFLYLPSQGVSNEIRSIQYNYAVDADYTGTTQRGNFGRILLRNAKGEAIVISKTANHVLLVEVEFEIVTA